MKSLYLLLILSGVFREINCLGKYRIYGGLYYWLEMMEYFPGDTGMIGTTQGICPDGWHIPTFKEWATLIDYLDGNTIAGGKLKDTGTIEAGTGLWLAPNEGATNETGFTALPGGSVDNDIEDPELAELLGLGEATAFWSSFRDESGESPAGGTFTIRYYASGITPQIYDKDSHNSVNSVRCVKDPLASTSIYFVAEPLKKKNLVTS